MKYNTQDKINIRPSVVVCPLSRRSLSVKVEIDFLQLKEEKDRIPLLLLHIGEPLQRKQIVKDSFSENSSRDTPSHRQRQTAPPVLPFAFLVHAFSIDTFFSFPHTTVQSKVGNVA